MQMWKKLVRSIYRLCGGPQAQYVEYESFNRFVQAEILKQSDDEYYIEYYSQPLAGGRLIHFSRWVPKDDPRLRPLALDESDETDVTAGQVLPFRERNGTKH